MAELLPPIHVSATRLNEHDCPTQRSLYVLVPALSQLRLLPNNDLGTDRDAIIKVDHIAVDQTEASRRNRAADRLRLIRAANAIDRVSPR
jgi:hypothetical protein